MPADPHDAIAPCSGIGAPEDLHVVVAQVHDPVFRNAGRCVDRSFRDAVLREGRIRDLDHQERGCGPRSSIVTQPPGDDRHSGFGNGVSPGDE